MQTKNKKNVMKIINDYAGNHKYLIWLGRILATVSAFVAMIPFIDIWRIIKIAIDGTQLQEIKPLAWQAVLVSLGSMLLYICALMCTHKAAFRVQANMSEKLLEQIISLPLGIFDNEGTGKIRRIVNETTAATETYIAHNLPDKSVATATPIGLLLLLFIFDWKFGLVCLIPAVLGFAFMMTMVGKDMQDKMAEYQNALESMSNEAVEYVRGVPVVKTFGQTIHSFKKFKTAIDGYAKWAIDYTISLRGPMAGFMTCINSVFAFIVGATFVFARGGVTPDIILNVMYYIIITPLLTVTLTKIAYSGEQEMVVVDAIERIDSILNMEKLEEARGNKSIQDYSISLENISYRYEGASEDAVHDMSVNIKQGQHVAFVGPSGGGKTTTAELIARFFDVNSGAIKIGGINVKEIPSEKLMKTVSFVFQDSKLLKTSILENVRLGKPDASEKEVMEALEKAQCMDIIEKLPNGINSVFGKEYNKDGIELSGGQSQKIAIARALYKKSSLVILDEPASALDPISEAEIYEKFNSLVQDKTAIYISHRMSSSVFCDKILIIDGGSVSDFDTHANLMQKTDCLYYKLFMAQAENYQLEEEIVNL